MDSLVHPTQLSVWHRFLQARRLHRETNRSKNTDWYRPALQLDYQLHLFLEGDEIADAHLCDRSGSEVTWTRVDAPGLDQEQDALKEYVSNLRSEHLSGRAKSLGVVLHLADEFAISELAQTSERPEDFGELSKQLNANPQEMLEDQSVSTDEHSFRLFPYPGARPGQLFGAAITISKKHHDFLRRFRELAEELNFPVQTAALSAPLVALGALPRLTSEVPGQPFCIFFSYSTFSVLAFFRNEGELVMLRSVRHHAGGTPPHVGRIIQTMAAALELPEPLVFVLPLSKGRQGEIVAGLPELPNASIMDWNQAEGFDPDVPFEFQGTVPPKDSGEEESGLAGTLTFKELAEGNWAVQDFLPPSQEEEELFPGQVEMKALRYGSLGVKVGAAILLLFLAWSGVRAFQILRDPAWHAGNAAVSDKGNQVLAKQIQRFEQWDSLLADRSKAWVTMELLNQLFPNPTAAVLTETSHNARPEVTREQKKASLVKEWTIVGYVNDEALEHLTAINTREGINKVFQAAYKVTGDESLRTNLPSRNLVVNLLASENKRYNPDKGDTVETQFPFMFNLTITQRISGEDPLAIPTAATK